MHGQNGRGHRVRRGGRHRASCWGKRDPVRWYSQVTTLTACVASLREGGDDGGRRPTSEAAVVREVVRYWTDPTTTRSSLRQDAWLFFLLAGASVALGALSCFWRPPGIGGIVLPVVFGVLPVGFTVAGLGALAAVSWIDRHGRGTTSPPRRSGKHTRPAALCSCAPCRWGSCCWRSAGWPAPWRDGPGKPRWESLSALPSGHSADLCWASSLPGSGRRSGPASENRWAATNEAVRSAALDRASGAAVCHRIVCGPDRTGCHPVTTPASHQAAYP
jgi:hypothetical protein